jgi:cysteine desulfurase
MESFQFEEGFGNPSSIHMLGIRASTAVEEARQKIADRVKSLSEEVCFLSGGSEANNWVVQSLFREAQARHKPFHWATTRAEHSSLTKLVSWIQSRGGNVTWLPVDAKGYISESYLKDLLKKSNIDLLSFSHANSETGTLQPLESLAKIVKQSETRIHVDACQSFLKTEIDFAGQNLDYLVLSSHKIHGPKGIGALVMRKGAKLKPLILGGGQEGGLRSGTLNTEGIVGFGEAVELYQDEDRRHLEELKKHMVELLAVKVPSAMPRGDYPNGIASILNFGIRGCDGKKLMQLLSRNRVCVSTGSACDSGSKSPSQTLMAMGFSEEEALSSLRISFSKVNNKLEIEHFIEILINCLKEQNHEP